MRLLRLSPRALALVAAGALGAPLVALGAPPAGRSAAAVRPPKPAPEPPSSSLGAPNQGRLVGGARLDDAPALRVYAARAGRDRRWALPELVGLLERSAERVARRHPGSVLGVGDLSQRGGGDISLHHSHESGRDADVGFYALGGAGRPFLGDDFVAFGPDGRSRDGRGLRFDEARNWELVEAWLTDPRARVTNVFIAEHLRARLLAHARRAGAPGGLVARAAAALVQPRHALPHDDHFHVRIACPPRAQPGCLEWPVARRPSRVAARGGKRGRPHAARAPAPARPPPPRAAPRPRPPPALHAAPAPDEFRPDEADVREVIDLFDEGGELKIVD
ncbi:MAG TPA: penicillin-insensitive murein endopeptidase [Polyangiaceae bacterium]|nr:penicillin-insensitive murein endopeptidase [Polyangiaceae bacterium]